jgi:hypothetical protein
LAGIKVAIRRVSLRPAAAFFSPSKPTFFSEMSAHYGKIHPVNQESQVEL